MVVTATVLGAVTRMAVEALAATVAVLAMVVEMLAAVMVLGQQWAS